MPVGAAFAISAATTVASMNQQKKAAKAQEKAQRIDQKRQDYTTARERRKQIRAARVAQAQVQAQSQAMGTATTSRTAGVSGGIQSELGANLSFLDTQQGFVNAIGQQNIAAGRASQRAGMIGAVGQLASSGIMAADGAGLFDKPAAAPKPAVGSMSPNPNRVTL